MRSWAMSFLQRGFDRDGACSRPWGPLSLVPSIDDRKGKAAHGKTRAFAEDEPCPGMVDERFGGLPQTVAARLGLDHLDDDHRGSVEVDAFDDAPAHPHVGRRDWKSTRMNSSNS